MADVTSSSALTWPVDKVTAQDRLAYLHATIKAILLKHNTRPGFTPERDAVEWLNLCAAEDADDPAGWEVVVYGLVRMAVAQREAGGKARILRMNDARALAAQAAALDEGRIE